MGTEARLTATTQSQSFGAAEPAGEQMVLPRRGRSRVVEVGVATGVGPEVVCDGRRQASPTRMSW